VALTTELLDEVRHTSAFKMFECKTAKLTRVNVAFTTVDERLAFALNLFNLMVRPSPSKEPLGGSTVMQQNSRHAPVLARSTALCEC
jgi:hypothetical protein